MKFTRGLCFIFLGAWVPGCMSLSSLQTARAIPEGEGRVIVGGGYYSSPDLNDAVGEDLSLPYMEVAYRRGLIENLEAGLKYTLPGSFTGDAKYQLVDTGTLALAAGAGLGYMKIESGEDAQVTTIDVQIPLYASFHPSEYLAVYTAPKYILRMLSGDAEGSANLGGATAGIQIGKDWGLLVESTYMKDFGSDFDALQFNGSFFF